MYALSKPFQHTLLIDWFCHNGMKANLKDKFQSIAVGIKTHDKSPVFKIGNADINVEDVVKLLGVDIDFSHTVGCHIQNTCKKAVQRLNNLKRLGEHLCKLSRTTFFHTFVLSNFNFCQCLALLFIILYIKIEKIPEIALRFVHDDYTSCVT